MDQESKRISFSNKYEVLYFASKLGLTLETKLQARVSRIHEEEKAA